MISSFAAPLLVANFCAFLSKQRKADKREVAFRMPLARQIFLQFDAAVETTASM
jgi:hypothetical protein